MIKKLLFVLLAAAAVSVNGAPSCSGTSSTGAYATFYLLLEDGSSTKVTCTFEADSVKGSYYGALDDALFDGVVGSAGASGYCGACVEMTGPVGTATVQIVDKCPTCSHSSYDIDLSPQAFAAIVGDQIVGVKPVTWTEVPCPWGTKPVHVITQGSNQWYGKFIIGGHVNRINKVEVGPAGGSMTAFTRGTDNGWTGAPGSPIVDVKITDIYGQEVTVSGVDVSVDPTYSITNGTSNFPPCSITSAQNINSMDYVSAYPNPAENQITFEGISGVTKLEVVNTLGEVVGAQNLNGSIEQISVDITGLTAGLYVVKMSNGSSVSTSTFVKK
jgi:expansin (peptidoglycan-binding protein)